MSNPMRKVKRISAPALQRSGRAVGLLVECDDGENIPLLIEIDDLRNSVGVLLDALDAAEVTEAVRPDDAKGNEDFTASPIVYQATEAGFVRHPRGGIQYLLVSTATGENICVGFEPHRLQNLLDQIADIQSIQTPPDDAPPS
jgi:hypothetical protein